MTAEPAILLSAEGQPLAVERGAAPTPGIPIKGRDQKVDASSNEGWTALLETAHLNHQSMAAMLIAAPANRQLTDTAGLSPTDEPRDPGYDSLMTVFDKPH
jgi:hypothetical protein